MNADANRRGGGDGSGRSGAPPHSGAPPACTSTAGRRRVTSWLPWRRRRARRLDSGAAAPAPLYEARPRALALGRLAWDDPFAWLADAAAAPDGGSSAALLQREAEHYAAHSARWARTKRALLSDIRHHAVGTRLVSLVYHPRRPTGFRGIARCAALTARAPLGPARRATRRPQPTWQTPRPSGAAGLSTSHATTPAASRPCCAAASAPAMAAPPAPLAAQPRGRRRFWPRPSSPLTRAAPRPASASASRGPRRAR